MRKHKPVRSAARIRRYVAIVAITGGGLATGHAVAEDNALDIVTVTGSHTSLLGDAESANAGFVTRKQLEARTVYWGAELLETVPGLIVSQHSGEGKASQFYLRGFNLDHGTDLKTTLDGMPVNQRSHAHGQGWTDLNFMIPELVNRLDYRKGPYYAEESDFASAGAARVSYADKLDQGITSAGIGQFGFRRTLLATSPEVGSGNLLTSLELMHNDGPFTRPDDYRKLNGLLRYSQGSTANGFQLAAMAYSGRWNATDQIPKRAVDSGQIGRFDAIDPSDGGTAQRYSLSGGWRRTDNEGATRVDAYLIRNKLDLYSNFTYFLDDPINGDQFNQRDRRTTTGIDASRILLHSLFGKTAETTLGVQLQTDIASGAGGFQPDQSQGLGHRLLL